MGINGLLPFVKPASINRHISFFRGKTVAVDTYCWLHKGAFGCAEKLAVGQKTDAYVSYCFKYIDMLLSFKIKPVLVFDGQNLPAKKLTELKRRESRKLARKQATECLKLGKVEEARTHFRKCVDITPEMALTLIKECRKKGIDCIVAPYEADAQLAFLNRTNVVDFIISEDSDLLAFGCSNVLFKLDLSGNGTLVEADKLYLATQERPEAFTIDRFRHMCILSGCDYLDSLPGIGLKKSLKFLKTVTETNIYDSISKLPAVLNMRHLTVTKEYREQFMIADATFRHQLVFNTFDRKIVPLTDPEACGTKLEYCCNAGELKDHHVAFQIAIGNLNPCTLAVLDTWCPDAIPKSNSIWSKSYKSSPNVKKLNNIVTKKKEINSRDNKPVEIPQTIEDDNINEKLLMMYAVSEPPAKKICIREDADNNTSENSSTSPVLSGRNEFINPFVKKFKSKFLRNIDRTVVDEQNVVVSKYFNASTNPCEAAVTDSDMQDQDTKSESVAEPSSTSEPVITYEPIEPQSCTSTSTSAFTLLQKSPVSTLNLKEITNVTVTSVETSTRDKKSVSTVTKKSLALCRRQGLSKIKKSKTQQTRLSMFGFTKK